MNHHLPIVLSENDLISLPSPLLIAGPAYSGKSKLAMDALDPTLDCLVIGTGDSHELHMRQRIDALKALRPKHWEIKDGYEHLQDLLQTGLPPQDQILVDSLNQWISAKIVYGREKYSLDQLAAICKEERQQFCVRLSEVSADKRIVMVSADLASSLPPSHPLERLIREEIATLNTQTAAVCKAVVTVQYGLPTALKWERSRI